jgi:hypothetical protein
VYANEAGHPWVQEDWLATLSAGAEVLACQVEEHVMFTSVELWRAGERQWRVVHDAQLGREHLAAEGALPPAHTASRPSIASCSSPPPRASTTCSKCR